MNQEDVEIHFLVIIMNSFETLYPIKTSNLKDIKNFAKKKNELSSLSNSEIISALGDISNYWLSSNFKLKTDFINNSFGFIIPWIKKNNIEKLLKLNFRNPKLLDYPESLEDTIFYLRPLGNILHWMTGNVPVITLISIFQGIITKNKNLVKVSKEYKKVFKDLFSDLEKANIKKKNKLVLKKILNSIYIFYVDYKDKDNLEKISQLADGRVIWGGFDAVSNVISLPKKINCRDTIFGPKISLALISRKKLKNLKNFYSNFTNDVFNFDQLGCNSPHNLVIETESNKVILNIARDLSKNFKYHINFVRPNIDPETKFNSITKKFKLMNTKEYKFFSDINSNWNIIVNTGKKIKLENPMYNRTVFIHKISRIDDLKDKLPENVQSIGLYVTKSERKKIIMNLSEKAGDRFPQIGKMGLYSNPWDGHMTLQNLVRWISTN